MKKALKCISFIIIVSTILIYVTSVFRFKYTDGIYQVEKFYELENDSVDVLVLGSSHAYTNVNTAMLWEDYGIAAYILGGSVQPIWNSYYFLEEALKTQHPRLIMLEGFTTWIGGVETSRIIKNTYGLKWSQTKYDALQASIDEDDFLNIAIGYNQYHGRYGEISDADFRTNQGDPRYANWKGFSNLTRTADYGTGPNVTGITERADMPEKAEEYYRKIIELAQANDIPIMIFVAPYNEITSEQMAVFNTASDIAAEYGVNFYNFNTNYGAWGLDFSTDYADGSHMNYRGSQKFADQLAAYITIVYSDSYIDRRGDARYESWALDSAYYDRTIYNLAFEQAEAIPDAIALASDANYTILLTISSQNDQTEELYDTLESMGINLGRATGCWVLTGGSTDVARIDDADLPYHLEPLKYDDLLITGTESGDITKYGMLFNNETVTTVSGGTNLVIYDQSTASIVKTMGF